MASASDQSGMTQSSPGLFDISLIVNGALQTVRVPARRLLSDCLRHDLRLTGTHVGCEHGVCGAPLTIRLTSNSPGEDCVIPP